MKSEGIFSLSNVTEIVSSPPKKGTSTQAEEVEKQQSDVVPALLQLCDLLQ
jgi:hypothetical protein